MKFHKKLRISSYNIEMDMMITGEIAGFIASIVATCSVIPQLIKTIRTQDSRSLSITSLFLSFIGNIGWFINGLAYDNNPLIFSGAILVVMIGMIISIKLKNDVF